MTWTKLDESFSDDPTLMTAGPLAELLQVRALQYGNRLLTDGVIPRAALSTLARGLDVFRENGRRVTPVALAERLVAAGVWERDADGYRIKDFLVDQPSRAKVLEERAAARKRMQRLRGGSPDVPPNNQERSPEVRDPVPSRPVGVGGNSTDNPRTAGDRADATPLPGDRFSGEEPTPTATEPSREPENNETRGGRKKRPGETGQAGPSAEKGAVRDSQAGLPGRAVADDPLVKEALQGFAAGSPNGEKAH